MRASLNPRELVIALVCGLPVSFMAAYGLPWMLAGSVGMLVVAPSGSALLGIAFVAACVLSLVTYWHLAITTALQRQFTFGAMFWLSIASASFVAVEVRGWFSGTESLLLLVGPLVASTLYFSWLQRRGNFRRGNEG